MRLRDRLVDGPSSVGERMRSGRWHVFRSAFPDLGTYNVLDLGGTTEYWLRAPVRPRSVTVVNLLEPGLGAEWITPLEDDACGFRSSEKFDLVVSNSLLEHVGGYAMRKRLAGTVLAGASRHWVQTPYRYFPVEPHWLFPGMQFLPVAARKKIAQHWPLIHTKPEDAQAALNGVLWTELVGRTEMQSLFPSSTVLFEKIVGIPKSLIAIQGGRTVD